MTISRDQFEDALASGDEALLAAARRHASTCARCAETEALWREISDAAHSMRRTWDTPLLWPRIERNLAGAPSGWPRLRRSLPLAAAASLALIAGLTWWMVRPSLTGFERSASTFLGDTALSDVERAEADYVNALDRLMAAAQPLLDDADTPLMLARREQLQLLESAITECKTEIENNRFNAALRRELLAMYQTKRLTLEEIIHDTRPAS